MDVLLLSNRGDDAGHWSEGWALAAARALVAHGARVRWLRAATGPPPPLPAGVEVATVVGRWRPFRCVEGRLGDAQFDLALARLLRSRPADIAHHFGFGAPGSIATTWLADRLGALALATVRAAEVLCHRQTLVDERGAVCRTFAEADRCTACCLAPPGLSAGQARAARLLRWLGGRSPFPHRVAFLNRFDLLGAGLQVCAAVLAPSALDGELLCGAGMAREVAPVGEDAEAAAAGLAGVYARLLAAGG